MKLDVDGTSMLVGNDTNWFKFIDRAQNFPVVHGDIIGVGSPYWHQAYMWKISGKYFRLFELPLELRNEIYDACATFTYPYMWHNGWNYIPVKDSIYPWVPNESQCADVQAKHFGTGRIINGASPIMSLFLSNKQLSAEFKSRLYKNMRFRLDPLHDTFIRFCGAPRGIPRADLPPDALARVSIGLSAEWWLTLLGAPYFFSIGYIDLLATSSLTVYISHQYQDYCKDTNRLEKTCHKVVTGIILFRVRHMFGEIPEIKVKSCISRDMVAKFEQLIDDDQKGKESSISQWDVIELSYRLASHGFSWLNMERQWRPSDGPMCLLLDDGESHECGDPENYHNEMCISRTGFCKPKRDEHNSS